MRAIARDLYRALSDGLTAFLICVIVGVIAMEIATRLRLSTDMSQAIALVVALMVAHPYFAEYARKRGHTPPTFSKALLAAASSAALVYGVSAVLTWK